MKIAQQQKKVLREPASKWSWPFYFFPAIVLAIGAFICYFPSRNFAFQFDDLANILKNYNIRLNTFGKLFYSNTRWVISWVNAINYSVGKFEPYYYRMVNISVHILLGILVFFFFLLALSRLKKRSFFSEHAFSIAFFTAGLFLLHPVQTQTVSYVIQGQLEGIASLFIMSMALCFLLSQYAQPGLMRTLLYLLLLAIAFIAPGTKEIAIVAPFLIMLVDWFFVAQGSYKDFRCRWWLHILLTVLVWGGYLFLLKPDYFIELFGFSMKVHNNLGNIITTSATDLITPGAYFISEFKVILHYLSIFLWPFDISVEYDWVLSRSFFAPDCLIPFLLLVAIAFFLIKLIRKDPKNLVAFGMLWFFIYIAPRSTIIPSAELLVDYKTYGASIGWLFVIASAILALLHYVGQRIQLKQQLYQSWPAQVVVAVLVISLCGIGTIQRNFVWSSGVEFWGSMIRTAPKKARIYNNYGVELSQNLKKYGEAVQYFQKAIELDRNYPDPHTNIAVSYAFLGKIDPAIAELQESLRINPYNPEAHNNIAAFYSQKKEYEKAEKELRAALALRPTYGKAFLNLACLYKAKGMNKEALEYMKQATTKADLDNESGFEMYGKMAMELKAYDEAIFAWSKAIELNPRGEYFFNMANAYYFKEDLNQALALYERARSIMGDDPRVMFNIGECYIKKNEIKLALHSFESIKNFIPQMPPIALRIADCYVKLGNKQQAESTLRQLMNLTITDDIKQYAMNTLNQIHAGDAKTAAA